MVADQYLLLTLSLVDTNDMCTWPRIFNNLPLLDVGLGKMEDNCFSGEKMVAQ